MCALCGKKMIERINEQKKIDAIFSSMVFFGGYKKRLIFFLII